MYRIGNVRVYFECRLSIVLPLRLPLCHTLTNAPILLLAVFIFFATPITYFFRLTYGTKSRWYVQEVLSLRFVQGWRARVSPIFRQECVCIALYSADLTVDKCSLWQPETPTVMSE